MKEKKKNARDKREAARDRTCFVYNELTKPKKLKGQIVGGVFLTVSVNVP